MNLISRTDVDIITYSPMGFLPGNLADKHSQYVIEICPHDEKTDSLLVTVEVAEAIGRAGASAKQNALSREKHAALPVAGYAPTQSGADVALANEGKELEERVLRYIERVQNKAKSGDARFAAIGRTQIELGFMAVIRAIFNPQRIKLPEDE
jgi:hypothetical protein